MKVLFISLGCDKNRVDSEVMLGILADNGFELTDDEDEAEAAVVNTCCFINDAKQESIDTILRLALRRKDGQLKALVVTGCLAQRYSSEIRQEIPEVDEIIGITSIEKIASAIRSAVSGARENIVFSPESCSDEPEHGDRKRIITTGGTFEYLKIAEGCDKNCTYCVIPKVRGHYRSVPMDELVSEASKLAEGGVQELILVAQETTIYGTDIYGEKKLPELLKRLCHIESLKWIRIMYCYPEEITEELIATIKSEKKICHYIDIPIQSGSDRILKRMGRHTDNADIRRIIGRIRSEIPDICIRTTLISGFPGETAADHNMTMQLVQDLHFDRLGVFTYSPEESTPAASMPDQIPERLKKTRRTKLMKLQQEIAFEAAEKMQGQTVTAIIEGRITDDDTDAELNMNSIADDDTDTELNMNSIADDDTDTELMTYVGRTYKDAPDIDGYIFITGVKRELMSGDFIKVRVTGSNDYDLIGESLED